jgi:hypothetical protein
MMQERGAACRDLRGPELKECMANYVGTPAESQNPQSDQGPRGKSDQPPVPAVPSQDRGPGTGDPSKK